MSEIKVGDELALSYGSGWRITKVAKVSPTGRITLAGGTVLNPDLSVRGEGSWSRTVASVVTPKILETIERHSLRARVERRAWTTETTDQLRRIVAILDERK
jgi:hypothetical protein